MNTYEPNVAWSRQQYTAPYGTYGSGIPGGFSGGMPGGMAGGMPGGFGGGMPGGMAGGMPGGFGGGMPGGMAGGMPGTMTPPQPSGSVIPGVPSTAGDISNVPGMLPIEQSYIENILRLNKGKTGTFYFTYENNNQWNAKVYRGIIEAAGRDHIIISDPQTGKRYLLLMVNLDWVEFDEPLNYEYPLAGRAARPTSAR